MQWYLENTKIAGATEASFMPTQSGAYKVELIDVNGCLAASDKIYVSILGQELENPWTSIIAYPNPAQASMQFGIPDKWKFVSASFQIVDLVGKRWIEKPLSSESIDLRMLPAGNYIIYFQGLSGQKPIKFTKF
jgi:hypothetical protein